MAERTVPSVRPQPMIAVADVEKASRWYQQVLDATSGHGGPEYEQLLVDGELIMQLHRLARQPERWSSRNLDPRPRQLPRCDC